MDPDPLKEAWHTQGAEARLTIDADVLLKEVQRNEHYLSAMIFWRDFREVGTALVMIPVWIYLGLRSALPWTWYLSVPAFLWIAGYMLLSRKRSQQQQAGPDEPLRRRVESSLAQVDHQIQLLRKVFWWYLLPLGLPMLAFFGQVTWQARAGGWSTALATLFVVTFVAAVFAGIYWLNQYAVRAQLEPRRRELQTLFVSLGEEPPDSP